MKNQNNHKRTKLNQLKAKDKQSGFIKNPAILVLRNTPKQKDTERLKMKV